MTNIADLTVADLDRVFEQCKNWGRWGADDQRGALNFITPATRVAAAALVREGGDRQLCVTIGDRAVR